MSRPQNEEGADYPDDRAASRQFPKYVSRARRELANRPRYTFSGPPSAPYNKRPAHFTGDSSASLASHKSTTWDHGETTSGIGPHTFTLGGYAVRPPRSAGGDFSASSSYSQGQNMRRSGVASRKYPVQPAVRLVPENSKKMMTKTGLAPRAGYDHNLKYQQRGSHGRIMNNTARYTPKYGGFYDPRFGNKFDNNNIDTTNTQLLQQRPTYTFTSAPKAYRPTPTFAYPYLNPDSTSNLGGWKDYHNIPPANFGSTGWK